MSDTNPAPAAGNDEPLSFDDGVEALTDLMPDPETDLKEEDQGQEEAEETEAEGDEPEAEETEATEEEPAEEQDGPGYESGKFAADTANVRLKDGTVISVQDLKRGYLSQASFTRGTQENAKERETLASQKAEFEQHARTLQEQRDFILQVAQQYVPQPPDRSLMDQSSPNYDPLRYMALKDDYEQKVGALSKLQNAAKAEADRLTAQQQKERKELQDAEAKRLVEIMPELKKPEVYNKFWSEAVETMSEYGFSQEEMANSLDHRLYPIFRDLAAYRRARKNLPAVKQAVQSKPVLTGKKRMDPKAKTSRDSQVRSEQLRKTGDFDAGVRALMDLDL
ncbi:hypothetical protein [Bradyrhizobium sp. SZCCHNRI1073]|uniref:hypothetical protein n=1 Tax=Bradyrhizobium sp. SZCCHNRI1073 TaxID=3057280 RepID=UPI002916BBB8|nr:hypothetical protein [Bradyrhizobium sp. SZCCHNRI1073]